MSRFVLPAAIVALFLGASIAVLAAVLNRGSSLYTLAKTRSCLIAAGHPAVATANPALPASGGHLTVTLIRGFGEIYIAFGKNAKEALAIRDRAVELALRSLAAHHAGLPRSEIIAGTRTNRNVFYYSSLGAVSLESAGLIDPCLR
jgi:hypothetical protein